MFWSAGVSAQKGHKHIGQLNLLCMLQLDIYSSNKRKGGFRSPVEWSLPGPRQSPRKVPPTAAETEPASTSVEKRWCLVKGDRQWEPSVRCCEQVPQRGCHLGHLCPVLHCRLSLPARLSPVCAKQSACVSWDGISAAVIKTALI